MVVPISRMNISTATIIKMMTKSIQSLMVYKGNRYKSTKYKIEKNSNRTFFLVVGLLKM